MRRFTEDGRVRAASARTPLSASAGGFEFLEGGVIRGFRQVIEGDEGFAFGGGTVGRFGRQMGNSFFDPGSAERRRTVKECAWRGVILIGFSSDERREAFHNQGELLGLGGKLLRSGSGFFSAGGVALGDFVHLGHGGVDLFDALRLLVVGCGDFADEGIDLGGVRGDFLKDFDYFDGHGDAVTGIIHGVLNHGGGGLGGFGGAHREIADFFGDDCESLSGLAGAGGFNRRVEGE